MEKCRTLREYSQYVDRVRKYAKRMRIEEMRKIRASEYKNGKEEGIIETCKDLGLSFEQTVEKLKLRFNISEQEAREKVRRLWD